MRPSVIHSGLLLPSNGDDQLLVELPSGVIKHCWEIPELATDIELYDKTIELNGELSSKPCLIATGEALGWV